MVGSQPQPKSNSPVVVVPPEEAVIVRMKDHLHLTNWTGCQELFVGAGWGGIYSFYRRVLHGVHEQGRDARQYCLLEQSGRLGGRTYSVPVSSRHTKSDHPFVLDVGAYRFTPDMHLIGDLISHQLQLPTACYEPHCPTPTWDEFQTLLHGHIVRRRHRQRRHRALHPSRNYTAPFRRMVDPDTGLSTGFDTALQKMVETCQQLGARVFYHTKLVEFRVNHHEYLSQQQKTLFGLTPLAHTQLVVQDMTTGVRSSLDSQLDQLSVIFLNLPRHVLLNTVQGVRESLEPHVRKTLECIVWDIPEDLYGRDVVQRLQAYEQTPSTIGKAYLYYDQAWWRSQLNQTVGHWPMEAGSMDAITTPQGVFLLKVRWHDGPVQCQGRRTAGTTNRPAGGLSIATDSNAENGNDNKDDDDMVCRGFLEVYYSISDETFYSSLPEATVVDEDELDKQQHQAHGNNVNNNNNDEGAAVLDPLGMVWVADSPHAQSELNLAHAALMQSLQPLWNQSTALQLASQLVPQPLGMVVGIWQRPNRYHPLGVGWTNPSKVYYEPSMSGTPDKACGVPGLTENSYRHVVLQPFDPIWSSSSLSKTTAMSSVIKCPPSTLDDTNNGKQQQQLEPPPRIFVVNNDFVCTNVRHSFGDWAEESLIQAERAMYELQTPKPAWIQNDWYYQQHVVEPQQQQVVVVQTTVVTEPPTTANMPGMKPASMAVLIVLGALALVAFLMEVRRRRREQLLAVAVILELSSSHGLDPSLPQPNWNHIIMDGTKKMGLQKSNDTNNREAIGTQPGSREESAELIIQTDHGTCAACPEGGGGERDRNGGGNENCQGEDGDDDDEQHLLYCKEELNLWRWKNLAIPISYCACGVSGGLFRTFLNVYPLDIGANEAQQTTVITLSALPAVFKILYGFTSDTNPWFGYRRKPYLFVGWFLCSLSMVTLFLTSDLTLIRQLRIDEDEDDVEHRRHRPGQRQFNVIVPENAPSLVRLSWCFFLYGVGMWLSNAMADAWVAEKAKHEPDAIRGSLQSTCYVMRFFGLMVSAPISTYLYSKVGPQVIVLALVCIPFFVLPLIWWLAEAQVEVKPVREQCQEIWNTVCLRSVWEPMAFLYIFNLLQVTNAAWRQFLVTVLGFTPANLNTLLVVSYALVYLGTMLYKYCLLHTSWRLIYQCCLVLNLVVSSLQLLLISGHTFGMPPFLFALGDDAFGEFLSGIQFLPAIVMMVSLCPSGSEGVSYAMFTTVMNSSWMIANVISSLLLGIWDVSKETLEEGNMDGMFKLSLMTTIVQCSPLLFVHWLPHGRKELEALTLRPFSGSPIGGGIFLFVLFSSMAITLVVSILNITRPGWAGES
ncbi:hypothetical protein ACA910_017423 [Epithemia clementina (nom. ined.)]